MPFELIGGKIFLGIVVVFFCFRCSIAFRGAWKKCCWLRAEPQWRACTSASFCCSSHFARRYLQAMLARWIPPYMRHKDKYIANVALMAAVVVAMIHYFPTRAALDKKVAETYPVAALEYLNAHPIPGKMLDYYGFGGYLVFAGRPVFIDGRGDLYERSGVFGDYVHLNEFEPGSLEILRNYGIDVCLLGTKQSLAAVLAVTPEWRRVYGDDTSVIFVRSTREAMKNSTAAFVSRPPPRSIAALDCSFRNHSELSLPRCSPAPHKFLRVIGRRHAVFFFSESHGRRARLHSSERARHAARHQVSHSCIRGYCPGCGVGMRHFRKIFPRL